MSLRTIVKNAGWMGLTQAFNYALPIITVPFVTRALGAELYGVYALGIAYGACCSLLVDYGFYFDATRDVSSQPENLANARRTHSVVMVGKLLLAFVAFLGLLAVVRITGASATATRAFVLLALSSMLWSIAPLWVFVALQRMAEIARGQMIIRSLSTLAIVLLIRSPADFMLFVWLQFLSYLAMTVYFLLRLRVLGIGFARFSLRDLRAAFAGGAKFFLVALASGAYLASAVIIVRQVTDLQVLGHFALADRLRVTLSHIVLPFSLAIYPFVSSIGARSPTRAEERTKAVYTYAVIGCTLALSVFCFLARHWIVRVLAGSGFAEAAMFFAYFALTPLLAALNNLFSTQTLIAQGFGRTAVHVQVTGAVIGIALIYAMALRAGVAGACGAILFTDLAVVAALFFCCLRLSRRPNELAMSPCGNV